MRVRFRFVLISTLPVLLLTLVNTIGYYASVRTISIARRGDELTEVLALKRMMIDSWLDERVVDLREFSQNHLAAGETVDLAHHATRFLAIHDEFVSTAYADRTGDIRFDALSSSPAGEVLGSVADREFFLKVMDGDEHWVSRPATSSRTGRRYVTVAVPVSRVPPILALDPQDSARRSGDTPPGDASREPVGVLFGPVYLTVLDQVVASLETHTGVRTRLADSSGLVMAGEGVDTDDELPVVVDGDGTVRYVASDDDPAIGVATTANSGRWIILMDLSLQEALAAFSDYFRLLLWASVAATVAAMLVGLAMSRAIVRPIGALSRMATLVDRHEYGEAVAVTDPAGAPVELIDLAGVFRRTIRELDGYVKTLEHASITDPLTGLPNRRQVSAQLHRTVHGCLSSGGTCSVMMLDLDHFKQINDRWGHEAGDRALVAFAGVLSRTIRSTDLAGRIGGEEFCVVCPDTVESEAVAVAERVRDAARGVRLPEPDQDVRISVSIGVAELTKEEISPDTTEALLRAADKAMYLAKECGRNQVRAAKMRSHKVPGCEDDSA